MKKLYVFIFLLTSLCVAAHAQKRTFLRLYSIAGNKFSKGHFYGTTDSSILIYKDSGIREIAATNIGYIKTRRSFGHNVLVGALIGAIPSTIIGAVSGESKTNDNTFGGVLHDAVTFTPVEAAAAGLILGGIAGTATGALVSAFTKTTTFTINGSLEEWRIQKRTIDLLPAYHQ